MRLELVLDGPINGDKVYNVSDVPVYIDAFTMKYLDEDIKIDYQKSYGYSLKTDSEMLEFGLSIK